METIESSSAPDSVGTKRKEICKESVGIIRTRRRKSTDKVHIGEEKETNPTSLFAVGASLRRSKHHNALHTPINLKGPPNIYRSAQTSNVLQSRRQRVVHPPPSSHIWFKSVLDQQDSLRICHEPVKNIPEACTVLHSLMNLADESERIVNAIELDKNKKELKMIHEVKAEAKQVLKVREKSLDTLFSNRGKGISIYWYSSEAGSKRVHGCVFYSLYSTKQ